MKSLLQINLDAKGISKELYSFRKNSIRLFPYQQNAQNKTNLDYHFDSICYNYHDINEAILYDIIIERVQKKSCMRESCLIFDQMYEQDVIDDLLMQINKIDMFKGDKIEVSHFLINNGNGLFDYFNTNSKKMDDSAREFDQNKDKESQQNFMLNFHKELNLCEEIRPYQVENVYSTTKYLDINEYFKRERKQNKRNNISWKRQERQLENRKVSQFYMIKIGENLKINCIVFNYNKNYSLPPEQKKDIYSIFTLFNSETPEIKYKSVKIQIISKLIKNCQKLYYITYFPGPQSEQLIMYKGSGSQSNSENLYSSRVNYQNSSKTPTLSKSGFNKIQTNDSLLQSKIVKISPKKLKSTCFSDLLSSHKRTKSKNIQENLVYEYLTSVFTNYEILKEKNKEEIQNIIKEYIEKKEEVLKVELDRVRQNVKELKIAHRIEQCQVSEIKQKTIRSLEKMAYSIKELQKMGIKNIGKHISWLQMITEEKKQQIKEEEQTIEAINQRIIQNQQQHQYFVKKMSDYRDRLILKNSKFVKKQANFPKQFHKILKGGNQLTMRINCGQKPENNEVSDKKEEGVNNKLNEHETELLEAHCQNLKKKMNEKLKISREKKIFIEKLAQIKPKISKMEFSRLEQKYFDLIID